MEHTAIYPHFTDSCSTSCRKPGIYLLHAYVLIFHDHWSHAFSNRSFSSPMAMMGVLRLPLQIHSPPFSNLLWPLEVVSNVSLAFWLCVVFGHYKTASDRKTGTECGSVSCLLDSLPADSPWVVNAWVPSPQVLAGFECLSPKVLSVSVFPPLTPSVLG